MLYTNYDIVEQHIEGELDNLSYENGLLKRWIRENAGEARCAVCGEKIFQLSMQRMTRPVLWHNRKCFEKKPGKIIALERDFGCDIIEILQETTRKCGNIRAQCHLLGISIPYLYIIIKKYGGDRLEFMARNSAGKRKELYAKKVAKRTAKNNGR